MKFNHDASFNRLGQSRAYVFFYCIACVGLTSLFRHLHVSYCSKSVRKWRKEEEENHFQLYHFPSGVIFRRQRILDVFGLADDAAVQRERHLDSFQEVHRGLPSPAEHFPQSAKVSARRGVSLSRESRSGKHVFAEVIAAEDPRPDPPFLFIFSPREHDQSVFSWRERLRACHFLASSRAFRPPFDK